MKRLLAGLIFVVLSGAAAQLLADGVSAMRLSNGMQVIVKEDHRAPVVVSQVWYRAGSMDEFNGTTGVAHVLEHMMFKGTGAVPAGEFTRLIAAAGGKDNAFTSSDHTVYFQQLRNTQLPLALRLEADRMHNLRLTDALFNKEIQVVMEERRMRTEDNPQARVHEAFMAAAFPVHPYGRPVIGWMNDLQNMQGRDARDWYTRWYAPNNAVLVVVGDVQAKQVFALAQRWFGAIPARALPLRKPQTEPEQRGERRIVVKAPAQLPYLLWGYRVPVLLDVAKDWEPYALEVLAGVLDGNTAARLPRRLVRESRLASDVGVGYESVSRGPGLFMLEATPAEGKTVAEVEAALRTEIRRLQQEGINPEELQRVKAQVRAGKVFERDSMFYQAMQLGEFEIAGLGYQGVEAAVNKLDQVTAEQVQAVARRYLVDDGLTVAVLDPQPLEQGKPVAAGSAGGAHVH